MSNEEKIMDEAQVFASAWSMVGGPFDSGNALDDAEAAKEALRQVVRKTLAEASAPAKPRLIGWRTADYLMETSDKKKAENWSVHHEIQPVFEGDPNTALVA